MDPSFLWVPSMFVGVITLKQGPFKRWHLRGDDLHPINVIDAAASRQAILSRDTSLDIVLLDKWFAILTQGLYRSKL